VALWISLFSDGGFRGVLADDRVLRAPRDYILDVGVLVPREDDEMRLTAAKLFVFANAHAHRFSAVLLPALAEELGLACVGFRVTKLEPLRYFLDAVVDVTEQAFVGGNAAISPHSTNYAPYASS
jgi:hypothetical protein